MPTVHVEAQLTTEELLRAVAQLDPRQLDDFAARVLAVRAERRAPVLSPPESQLLAIINRGLEPDVQARFDALVAKRQDETLTPEEHAELVYLTDRVEAMDANRVEALAELARMRGTSLRALMADLGIKAPEYA